MYVHKNGSTSLSASRWARSGRQWMDTWKEYEVTKCEVGYSQAAGCNQVIFNLSEELTV